MKTKRKVLIGLLLTVAVMCVGYIGYFVYNQYIIPMKDDKEVDSMRDVYVIEPETEEPQSPTFEVDENGNLTMNMNNGTESTTDTSQGSGEADGSEEDSKTASSLQQLKDMNENINGWIFVKGTSIDYPVVRTTNNDYYLNHDHNGNRTINGAIYMDYRCDSRSQNIVIYGHHMNADIMFSSLVDMKERSYAEEHPTIYLDLGDEGSKYWDVIASFACREKEAEKFQKFSFTPETIGEFIEDIKSHRYFEIGPEFGENNQYLTLITCSYEYYDARTIVIAKRK